MAVYNRAIHRETLARVFDVGRTRNVIVSVSPTAGLVTFRLKGTRRAYALPASYLYWHALQKAVSLEKARKAKERKRRKAVSHAK